MMTLDGCATLGQSRTAQAVVAAAAAPAEDLAVAALDAELAALPADPAGLHAWCLSAGLTQSEADLVVAEAGAELAAALGSLPRYIDDGAFGRLALSALAGKRPEVVGPRDAARFLLAWAGARRDADPSAAGVP
ncbi:hypothetical protein L6R50_19905 [Myxococcota bacterium]|nr:hypothetical protein [Myxococcota bacterium]